MLIVSGTLPSGKTVFEEVIPPQEMIKEFSVPPMGKYAEFRIDSRFTKRDAETGEIRVGRAQSFVPAYTISTPNGSVNIRYADTRLPDGPGSFKYSLTGEGGATNRMMDFRDEMFVFNQPSQVEKFIWYFLHPLNGSNPFKKQNGQYRYWYLDRETEARKKLDLQRAVESIKSEIMDKDEPTIRVYAAGLSYKVNGIERTMPNLDTASISQLRLMLLDRLNADGEAFVQAWRTGNNSLYGMIVFAVDKGLIRVRRFQGGASWVWNTESHKDAPIANITTSEPEMATLKRVFNDNYENLVPILQSAINALRVKEIELPTDDIMATQEELTMSVLLNKGWDWIVSQAMLKGLLAFDYNTGSVRAIVNGKMEQDLYTAINPGNWSKELVDRLKTHEGASLRLPISNALLASFNDNGQPLTALDLLKNNTPAKAAITPPPALTPVPDPMFGKLIDTEEDVDVADLASDEAEVSEN